MAYSRGLSYAARAKCFLSGFFPNKLQLYSFEDHDRRLFVNDRQLLAISHINGPKNELLNDKVVFTRFMQDRVRVPELFVAIRGKKTIWYDAKSDGDLLALIRDKRTVFAKPIDQLGGRQARLLEFRDEQYWQNDEAIDGPVLERALVESGNLVVCEYVRQGAYADRLFSRTVNTIRMLTMFDPYTGDVFIAGAGQRVGSSGSVPVDNNSSGGLSCVIDLETGRLSKGSTRKLPFCWLDRHPDSNVVFEDQVVPRWRDICHDMLKIASELPMLPHIAWDIAQLDDDICVIEANGWMDLAFFQVCGPILVDPRVRSFYKYHGVL